MGKRSRQPKARTVQRKRGSVRERIAIAADQAEKIQGERPVAPWDPFPLVELTIFAGIVAMLTGWVVGGSAGGVLLTGGLVLASIGGLDNSLREHFTGFRSHSMLLAGIIGVATLIITVLLFSEQVGAIPRVAIVIGVTGTAYSAFRKSFIRRSGGKRLF